MDSIVALMNEIIIWKQFCDYPLFTIGNIRFIIVLYYKQTHELLIKCSFKYIDGYNSS